MISRFAFGTSLFVAVALSANVGAQAPPRYKLQVGQEIQYEQKTDYFDLSDPKKVQPSTHTEDQKTIWAVGRHTDGSVRIVEHDTSKTDQVDEKAKPTSSTSESISGYDLSPTGRIVFLGDPIRYSNSNSLFPPLPASAADQMWQSDEGVDYSKVPQRATSTDFVFRHEDRSLDERIYLSTHTGTIHFDLTRGLVASEVGESTQDYGFHVRCPFTLELKSVEMKDPAFVQKLADESQIYFNAIKEYEQAERIAGSDSSKSQATMAHAGEALREARGKISLAIFANALDKMLSRHDHIASYLKEQSTWIDGLLNKPSIDWQLKDLHGMEHRLVDFRGKVLVLDFWYRGCGWCTKAMPTMKKLADDLRNEPVTLLGMNADRKVSDAQFVADTMQLNYDTLLATDISRKYGVHAFPTAMILDEHGVVRAVHVGYSPNLGEELESEIRKLLPGIKTSAATPPERR